MSLHAKLLSTPVFVEVLNKLLLEKLNILILILLLFSMLIKVLKPHEVTKKSY